MSQNQEYLIKQKVKEILKATKWRCRMCDTEVDALSNISTNDEKQSILMDHLHTRHLQSPYINRDMKDEYLPGYFRPIIEVIQPNINFMV